MSVVGTTGSGKTRFAADVAAVLGCPHVELDALHWDPGWTPAPIELFRERTAAALAADRWVVDGNYTQVRDMVWERADTVVWLNYSLPVMMSRTLRRTGRRIVTREELWNGNKESLRLAFAKDSVIWWQLKTFRRRRREYPARFADPRWSDLEFVTLRSPREARRWLERLAQTVAVG